MTHSRRFGRSPFRQFQEPSIGYSLRWTTGLSGATPKETDVKTRQVWANLPSSDVEKTRAFYRALGFAANGDGGDEGQLASFVVGENDFVVHFFAEERFETSIEGKAADTVQGSEVMFTLSADGREEVDQWAEAALAAGGSVFSEPQSVMDSDKWYGCGFADPDGHKWNVFFSGQ